MGLKVSDRRVVDSTYPMPMRLGELDLAESYAWWLTTQCGVNIDTAWGYLSTVNAWHLRRFYVPLAGGLPMDRIKVMLDGLQRRRGEAVPRRKRSDRSWLRVACAGGSS